LNDTPTLGGWENFWSQVVLSTPSDGVCYVVAFGNDYYGSLTITYEVV
jgi:hypothetical protein